MTTATGKTKIRIKCYVRDESKPFSEQAACQLDINHEGHHDHGGHRWSMRVNGLRHCYDCDVTDYDSQWGAGIFSDWPRGHHKPFDA
jgi:hypothetical protein